MENAIITLVSVFCTCGLSFGALYVLFGKTEQEGEQRGSWLVQSKIGSAISS